MIQRRGRPFTGRLTFALLCRAGDFACRTDDFLKFYNVRRGQDPALQTGANGQFSRKPRVTVHPCRAACMPPLRIDQTSSQPKNGFVWVCGPRAFAPRKRFFFVDTYISFVGAAYMPPGRGMPRAGFVGKPTFSAALQRNINTLQPVNGLPRRSLYLPFPIFCAALPRFLSALRAAFGGCAPRRACGRSTFIFHF